MFLSTKKLTRFQRTTFQAARVRNVSSVGSHAWETSRLSPCSPRVPQLGLERFVAAYCEEDSVHEKLIDGPAAR